MPESDLFQIVVFVNSTCICRKLVQFYLSVECHKTMPILQAVV